MSSAPFKNIAIVGGGGNVGLPIISALLASPHAFNITVLTRSTSASASASTFPPGVAVKIISDYNTHSLLVSALQNQEVLICTLHDNATSVQIPLIHAAIEAGVHRFIPSEFASNEWTPPVPELEPLVAAKAEVRELLLAKAKEVEGFYWTGINAGIFFDWCLYAGLFDINLAEKKALIWNTGTAKLSLTNLSTAAQAVVSLLSSSSVEEKTRNRFINIESFAASQGDILSAIEKISREKWAVEKTTTAEQYGLARKEWDMGEAERAYLRWLMGSVYVERAGWPFAKEGLANELLGLKEESLEESLKPIILEG